MYRLLLAFCFLASANGAFGAVRIVEVGLQSYFPIEPWPTRVRIQVTNTRAEPQSIDLTAQVSALPPFNQFFLRHDAFSKTVAVGPYQQLTVDLPLVVSSQFQQGFVLAVEARSPAGELLGRDVRGIGALEAERLIAIVCPSDSICKEAASQIMFSGGQDKQALKAKRWKYVTVQDIPSVWWAYSVASAVVVVTPLVALSQDQREALEDYLRQGGRLILVEKESADPTFLAAYRQGPATTLPLVAGRGRVYRARSLQDHALGEVFSAQLCEYLMKQSAGSAPFSSTELPYLLKRLGTSFAFPSLGWLLAWLAAYILCVGLVNFTVLSRLHRRDWGWVTVPLVAVLFALGLYASSAAKRPRKFGVDEVSLYWMDDRSPLAAAQYTVRVSSPRRRDVSLAALADAAFCGQQQDPDFGVSLPRVGFRGGAGTGPESGYRVRFGTPQQVQLGLLQWSFQDLQFRGMKRFPGTVHRVAAKKLLNASGMAFTDALYADADRVYFLGRVAKGEEIDLSKARQEALTQNTGRDRAYPNELALMDEPELLRPDWSVDFANSTQEWGQLPKRPFALVEFLRGWPKNGGQAFRFRSGLFLGLANDTGLEAGLPGLDSFTKPYSVTIVSLGPQP
jgi:hypothetical protein